MRIEARDIEKRFGQTLALRRLGFTLQSPASCVLLGANGAGKSTLLSLLASLLRVDRGALRFDGIESTVALRSGRIRVGMLAHDGMLYGELGARENLVFFARLLGVDLQRVDELLETLGIVDYSERRVRELSRGIVQRLGLARALLNEPELLLLDEPFSGLDAEGSARLRELLRSLRASNRVIVISTHALQEKAADFDRALVLDKGRLCFDGELQGFDSLAELYATAATFGSRRRP